MLSRLLKKEEINRFKLDNNSYQKFVKRNFCNYPWRFYKNGQKLLREDRYNSQCISNHDKNRTYFFHRFTEAYLYPFSYGQKFFVRKRLSTPFQLYHCASHTSYTYTQVYEATRSAVFSPWLPKRPQNFSVSPKYTCSSTRDTEMLSRLRKLVAVAQTVAVYREWKPPDSFAVQLIYAKSSNKHRVSR